MKDILSPLSDLLVTISASARLEILLMLGSGEACVCYLEARLGYRQAYISQHLMALRQAGLIDSRREGKYIFYHLSKPELLELIQNAANLAGVILPKIEIISPQAQCAYSAELIVPVIENIQERHS
ncbi:MAG: metalloregulator ArsR/SmtB family transcription factor [Chloroflexi bacterium]|nr:metalloregulator ArsR/SmtB family transcription factor [Chloroflexota bacterium]